MAEIKIQLDDNKDLIKALESRTKLLEKLLGKKGLDVKDVAKMIEKSRSTDLKSFNRMTSTLTSAMSNIRQPIQPKMPKINVIQKDNTSALVTSFNKRIAVLERLLRQSKSKTVVKTIVKSAPSGGRNDNRKLRALESSNNVILESLKGLKGGMSVIPSPS